MGRMAPARAGLAMRHNADARICLNERPPNANYKNRSESGQERF